MENNKYYQPELEEFHVGFEYERFNRMHHDEPFFWKEYIKKGESIYEILENIDDEKIRVKYLDREDIESLGFEGRRINIELEGKANRRLTDGFFRENKKGYPFFLIQGVNNYVEIFLIHGSVYKGSKFSGTIKNKSELKRVLKMIGV